jgi:acyl-CoA thioesterase FadM
MVVFGYEARMQETGQVLATGRTVHVCVDRAGQPSQIPAEWRAMMSKRT